MPTSLFMAVGLDGLRIASADGVKWTDAQTGREGESYRAVAFGNGLCVAVGSFGGDNILANTSDGKTWKTGKHDAKYVKYIRGLSFGNGQFLALGGDPGSVGQSKPFVMFSKDGLTWDGPHDVPGKHMLRRAAWGGGRFAAAGARPRRTARSGPTRPRRKPPTRSWMSPSGTRCSSGSGCTGFAHRPPTA